MNLITVNYTLSPNNISTEQPTNVTGIGIAGGGKLNFTWDGNTPSIFGVNKVNYLSKNKEAQT